jgi:hypothetical protein
MATVVHLALHLIMPIPHVKSFNHFLLVLQPLPAFPPFALLHFVGVLQVSIYYAPQKIAGSWLISVSVCLMILLQLLIITNAGCISAECSTSIQPQFFLGGNFFTQLFEVLCAADTFPSKNNTSTGRYIFLLHVA